MTDEAFPDALPVGYRLHWYVIEHVLGQGGFGITHLAHDTNLDRRVAIKEYLPADFGRRRSDASVRPRTEASAERYAWGLERFLAEARTLARFDHPNIVRVMSVFEANNTAYMVMRFEDGENLATLLERCGTLPERQLLNFLLPVLEGLQLVHDAGFIHRDIKPENIYVRKDGSPVLLDFGSARQSFGMAKTMTILVAPGYAPLEQYYGDAGTQGPWTDIYGLGATCYRAITGRAPLDAVARAKGVLGSAREILPRAVDVARGRYSEHLLAAVDHALQLGEIDRPQSVADWRREILAPPAQAPVARAAPAPAPPDSVIEATPARSVFRAPPQPTPPHDVRPGTEGHDAVRKRRPLLLWGLGATGAAAAVVAVYVTPSRVGVPATTPVPPRAVVASLPAASAVVATQPPPDQGASRHDAPPPNDIAIVAPKAAPVAASKAEPRDTHAKVHLTAKPMPSVLPGAVPPTAPSSTPATALAALSAPTPAEPGASAAPTMPSDISTLRHARDEQIDAAEAALRRGDPAAAADMLAPWAAAGVPRAQALLGRAKETGRGKQQSAFEAYVWYGVAARNGEPGAQAMRDKVAGKLQPAEIRQAEQLIERWKPRAESTAGAAK